MIIIGICLGATFQALSQSKRISWKSEEMMEALRIANNILSDSALIEAAFEKMEIEDEVGKENGWRYRLSASPLELRINDAETVVEIQSMVQLELCLIHQSERKEKPFCLTRWYRFRS